MNDRTQCGRLPLPGMFVQASFEENNTFVLRDNMNKWIKYATGRLYRPLVEWYLSSTREYTYKGIRLLVPPQVFHPGLFFSTRLLLHHIGRLPLHGQKMLELGAGNGLISFFAARQGASVTASDINPIAIEYLQSNSVRNSLPITVIRSDLFSGIPLQHFDIIAINPPYYKRTPVSDADYAWFCGEHGEYFDGLFRDLRLYMHAGTSAWMILNEACDMAMIGRYAANYGFSLACVWSGRNWLERNFLYRIEPWSD